MIPPYFLAALALVALAALIYRTPDRHQRKINSDRRRIRKACKDYERQRQKMVKQ